MFYLSPVVKKLLIANVVIFILQGFYSGGMGLAAYYMSHGELPLIDRFFALPSAYLPNNPSGGAINPNFFPWQVVTYMFLHGGWGHLFSNMFGLFIFGSTVESFMGANRFFKYYLITGIGAGIAQVLVNSYDLYQYSLSGAISQYDEYVKLVHTVGASGAIFGILVAYAYKFPNNELIIFPIPFPLKAKYFIILYGLYETFAGVRGSVDNVAHFAHIGGLLTGYILLRFFSYSSEGYNRNGWGS